MKVYDRLLMELSNQQYLTEEQYNQYLIENELVPTDEYIKAEMQKQLLFTVIDILEAVTNDIDLMTGISTEFSDIGQAYEFLEMRIINIKDKIASIPDPEEDMSAFSLMYTRGGTRTMGGYVGRISKDTIETITKKEEEPEIVEPEPTDPETSDPVDPNDPTD